MKLGPILAIAKKELKLNLRFKYNYFGNALLNPSKLLVMFVFIYSGFYSVGSQGVGGVTKQNYILFLLLGSFVYSFFWSGFNLFSEKFMDEKYWRTIEALLIAPVHRMKLVIGMGLSELLRQAIIMPVYLVIAFIILPISWVNFLIILLVVLLIYVGVAGFSLIYGAIALSNENFLFLFDYIFWLWAFLSCFYYPIDVLPTFIKLFILINPVYHGLYIIREIWINGSVGNFFIHFLIVLLFAFITPIIAVFLFNRTIKKLGVGGY